MATLSVEAANRLGFVLLGLATNFVYVVMLSAAYDLLSHTNQSVESSKLDNFKNSNSSLQIQEQQPYCHAHSTSTILLADTMPMLATKIIYPFLLVRIPASYKAVATALLAAAAFLITGLFHSQMPIFLGVICASFSSGFGESTFLSITPLYGDASLGGWSIGTGAASFFGSLIYALLRMILPVKLIMMLMLTIPILLLVAFFKIIKPLAASSNDNLSVARITKQEINFQNKLHYLPSLAKYFFPLLLVYFAEFFINQGLIELIYYPEVRALDHAAQYRWFQVLYRLGNMISRSTVELVQLKNIWTMSLLQFLNAILFLAHTSKIIHLPSFYLVAIIIVYEGLLGGLTYVNAFYRIKKEVPPLWQEFSMSSAVIADSLGIVIAGLVALPVHSALCQLY